jgi:hypothetical protein
VEEEKNKPTIKTSSQYTLIMRAGWRRFKKNIELSGKKLSQGI